MDKSRVCMSRTINLAKQNKTHLLVYEKPAGTSPPPAPTVRCLPISSPKAKRIRVCTGAEMKRMCRPPPCSCPPKKDHLGLMSRIFTLLGYGIKAALATSVVYWTWEAGVWGDSEETEEFYTNVCQMFTTRKSRKLRLSEACEAELSLMNVPNPPPAPDTCSKPPINKEKIILKFKETWNTTVTTLFDFVVGFPYNVIERFQRKPPCPDKDHRE